MSFRSSIHCYHAHLKYKMYYLSVLSVAIKKISTVYMFVGSLALDKEIER